MKYSLKSDRVNNGNKHMPIAGSKRKVREWDLPGLLDLPQELFDHVMSYCPPQDLWRWMGVNKHFRKSITNNQRLWHHLDMTIFKGGHRQKGATRVLELAKNNVTSPQVNHHQYLGDRTSVQAMLHANEMAEYAVPFISKIISRIEKLENLRVTGFATEYSVLGSVINPKILRSLDMRCSLRYPAEAIIAFLPTFPNLQVLSLRGYGLMTGQTALKWGGQNTAPSLDKLLLSPESKITGDLTRRLQLASINSTGLAAAAPKLRSLCLENYCFGRLFASGDSCDLRTLRNLKDFSMRQSSLDGAHGLPLLPEGIRSVVLLVAPGKTTYPSWKVNTAHSLSFFKCPVLKHFETNFDIDCGSGSMWSETLVKSECQLESLILGREWKVVGRPVSDGDTKKTWMTTLLLQLGEKRLLSAIKTLEFWAGLDPLRHDDLGTMIAKDCPELTTLRWRGNCFMEEITVRKILGKTGKRLGILRLTNTPELAHLRKLGDQLGVAMVGMEGQVKSTGKVRNQRAT